MILVAFLAMTCLRNQVSNDAPYMRGFQTLRWGTPPDSAKKLESRDSSWVPISSIVNAQSLGRILVLNHAGLDYYLEYDREDRFFSVSYIADRSDLDTLETLIARHYGAPEKWEKRNPNFESKLWKAESDSAQLEIQFVITKDHYSFKVINTTYGR